MIINSKTNNIVKYIKGLENKKNRDASLAFVIEGIKVVSEMINSNGKYPFEYIVYSKELLNKTNAGLELVELINKLEATIEVSNQLFKYISNTETPQGVLVVMKKPSKETINIDNVIKNNESVIVLDKIQDSGNLGTIIRSAKAFDVKNIICIEGTADIYSPKVSRSTMGAILSMNFQYINEDNVSSVLKKFKEKGYFVVGTKMSSSKKIKEIQNISKAIFVLGNESNGVGKTLENICDEFVKIPMEDSQDSLNVAVAASIIMYEKYIKKNKR